MAVQEHLHIALRREGDLAILALEGELDLASSPLFQSELENPELGECTRLVLDLRKLHFIDSTGLRVIFTARTRAQERGQRFAVTRGSEQVERLLTITRMGEHLQMVDEPDELLEQPSSDS